MSWFKKENMPHAVDHMSPKMRRDALVKLHAGSARMVGLAVTDIIDTSVQPLVGIDPEGFKRANQAMLDAAMKRDEELRAAIEKNLADAKAENARLSDEKAKNAKIIESALAALAVFNPNQPEPFRDASTAPPRVKINQSIVIYGPKASGKTRNILAITKHFNRQGCVIVDDWGGESILPPGSIATTTLLPGEFTSSDIKTDYKWVSVEALQRLPWWVK